MTPAARRVRCLACALVALCVAGCATTTSRPTNPPIARADPRAGYRLETRPRDNLADTIVILAFSGGGTRAAA